MLKNVGKRLIAKGDWGRSVVCSQLYNLCYIDLWHCSIFHNSSITGTNGKQYFRFLFGSSIFRARHLYLCNVPMSPQPLCSELSQHARQLYHSTRGQIHNVGAVRAVKNPCLVVLEHMSSEDDNEGWHWNQIQPGIMSWVMPVQEFRLHVLEKASQSLKTAHF